MNSTSTSSLPPRSAKDRYDDLVEKMAFFVRFPQVEIAIQRSKSIANADSRLTYLATRLKPFFDDLSRKSKFEGGRLPVDPQTFVESPEFLNQQGVLYPKVMEEFVALNSGNYIEAVLTGGIGVGKSTIAIFTTAYQLYRLSCMVAPQRDFGISPTDEIMFVFQSVSKDLALSVDFSRFAQLITQSPYFKNNFPAHQTKEQLTFPKNIKVKALSGATTAALGQNVFGGMLDEVNFMSVVEKSKNSHDGGGFDQAWANYDSIVRRRQSRFMRGGKTPGMFCLVSSKNYPGDFTDVKAREAQSNPTIFVYDKRLWEVSETNPDGSDRWVLGFFPVFIGDSTRKPRILTDLEASKIATVDQHLLMMIPNDYRKSFESNLLGALRDIAGVATAALHPFILDKDALASCFDRKPSLITEERVDFDVAKVAIRRSQLLNLHRPRWVHIDLALTGDSAGLSMGYCNEFTLVDRGDHKEMLPIITFDFVLEINPPKNGEINFSKIRSVLYKLTELGVPIRWVSLDTFQSFDTIQILRQKGYQSEIRSVDTSTIPYDVSKQALLDRRVRAPKHTKALEEFSRLEFDIKAKKIDHPARFSKDCSDSMASVIFGLTMATETWLSNNISIADAPVWLKQLEQSTRNKSTNAGRIGEDPSAGWAPPN